jgi:hypothetical protein
MTMSTAKKPRRKYQFASREAAEAAAISERNKARENQRGLNVLLRGNFIRVPRRFGPLEVLVYELGASMLHCIVVGNLTTSDRFGECWDAEDLYQYMQRGEWHYMTDEFRQAAFAVERINNRMTPDHPPLAEIVRELFCMPVTGNGDDPADRAKIKEYIRTHSWGRNEWAVFQMIEGAPVVLAAGSQAHAQGYHRPGLYLEYVGGQAAGQ